MCEIDNQQGPTGKHKELYSLFFITYKRKEHEKNIYKCI